MGFIAALLVYLAVSTSCKATVAAGASIYHYSTEDKKKSRPWPTVDTDHQSMVDNAQIPSQKMPAPINDTSNCCGQERAQQCQHYRRTFHRLLNTYNHHKKAVMVAMTPVTPLPVVMVWPRCWPSSSQGPPMTTIAQPPQPTTPVVDCRPHMAAVFGQLRSTIPYTAATHCSENDKEDGGRATGEAAPSSSSSTTSQGEDDDRDRQHHLAQARARMAKVLGQLKSTAIPFSTPTVKKAVSMDEANTQSAQERKKAMGLTPDILQAARSRLTPPSPVAPLQSDSDFLRDALKRKFAKANSM